VEDVYLTDEVLDGKDVELVPEKREEGGRKTVVVDFDIGLIFITGNFGGEREAE